MTTVLAAVNVVALLGVGGLFVVFSLLPFAMANGSPRCGPLVRCGALQVAAFGGLGVWVGGVVVTMTVFFGLGQVDMAVAEWRRDRAGADRSVPSGRCRRSPRPGRWPN